MFCLIFHETNAPTPNYAPLTNHPVKATGLAQFGVTVGVLKIKFGIFLKPNCTRGVAACCVKLRNSGTAILFTYYSKGITYVKKIK